MLKERHCDNCGWPWDNLMQCRACGLLFCDEHRTRIKTAKHEGHDCHVPIKRKPARRKVSRKPRRRS